MLITAEKMLMNHDFLLQTPGSFILNGRTHRVSGWMELDHELLEDLFAQCDRVGSRIADAVIPETEKKIVRKNEYAGKHLRLSNGLLFPADYSEREYALACRSICIAYEVTPCEMSIEYADHPEPVIPVDSPAGVSSETESPSEQEIDAGVNIKPAADVRPLLTGFESRLQSDIMIEPNCSSFDHLSETEEKWLKLMLEREEDNKPSDRILVTAYNDEHEISHEEPDWDNIIDHLKHDNQALAAAKMMKKAGIKAPVMNFRGIKEHNKVGGEALFVWMDEGVAYLHGRQKYSRGYFYERRFKHVILDDPRELLDCFRDLEAENE